MRRTLMIISVLAVAVAACGGDDAPTASTTEPPPLTAAPTTSPAPVTTVAPPITDPPAPTTAAPSTTGAPTTTLASTTTTAAPPPPTTTAAPVPDIVADPSLTERFYAVVLVDGDDVLNVRTGPGASFSILTNFGPTQTGIVLTGNKAQVGNSTWVEVETEDARGWVNKFFLAEEWALFEVDVQWNMQGPLNDFGVAAESSGDLGERVSSRGLFVVYHDDELRRWLPNELAGLMTDGTMYTWSTPGCFACVDDTFSGAIGMPFVNAWEDLDSDAIIDLDDILLGGNGPFPPETAIPVQFKNFHWLVIHDPGDDEELGGLDWQSWFVYYDYEDGEAVIVGLSRAAWGP